MAHPGDIARRWRESQGLTAPDLAREIGESRQNLENFEQGRARQPRWLRKLATRMGYASTDHLLAGLPPPERGRNGNEPLLIAYSGADEVAARVPVVGTARMNKLGTFAAAELSADAHQGTVDAHSRDPLAYAIRVVGDDLYPAIRHGWCVVVEPSGACVPGELVLIKMRDGEHRIRELSQTRPDTITVVGVNGGTRETIESQAVEWMRPIAHLTSGAKFIPAS